MGRSWKKHLDDIKPYIPGKPIEEVKREIGLSKVIKLASNENALGPSASVIKAMVKAAPSVNRYPDGGCFYLKRALSEKLSIPEDSFIFGNGSDEVILLALRAFVAAGDEVVVADPTFLIYHIASMVSGAKVRTVPLKDLKYDLKGMLKAMNGKTKAVFIANPDNPTGSYVTDGELREFIEKVPEDVLVFLDEAYYEFASGGDYPETLDLIERADRNIVIARTFSKVYSLAGLRLGYGMARREIAAVIDKVREPFNINSMAQAAAVAAIKDKKHLTKSLALVKKEKKRFYKVFDSEGLKYVPSKTNFVLVDTARDSKQVFRYLLERGVIVREMTPWNLEGYIRVTMGLPEENDMFFKILKKALKEIPKCI